MPIEKCMRSTFPCIPNIQYLTILSHTESAPVRPIFATSGHLYAVKEVRIWPPCPAPVSQTAETDATNPFRIWFFAAYKTTPADRVYDLISLLPLFSFSLPASLRNSDHHFMANRASITPPPPPPPVLYFSSSWSHRALQKARRRCRFLLPPRILRLSRRSTSAQRGEEKRRGREETPSQLQK